ncbi:MAG: Smr/MutS family protein [bacterium]
MGRKKRQSDSRQPATRRGKRRSIRFDAYEEDPEQKSRERDADKPPEISLRRLQVDEALVLLEAQIMAHAGRGRSELLVVHGRGHGSPGGVPILKQLVRDWCSRHTELVKSWREAPPRWGGAGAIVIRLR